MQKIKIFTDSTADVPVADLEKYGIGMFPIKIQLGDDTYKDAIDITIDEFYKKLEETDEMPTTSQVTVVEFEEGFKKAVEEGYETIICFTLSKEASGTYQNAVLAKKMVLEEYPDADIEIISGQLSYVYGNVVTKAGIMAQNGADKKEIMDTVQHMFDNFYVIFVAGTLKYLKKGGRINPAVATIGEVLNIKPILTLKDGLVDNIEKVRGDKKIIPKMIEYLAQNGASEAKEMYIFDGAAGEEKIEAVRKALEDNFGFANAPAVKLGSVIGAHIGPGVYGVLISK